MARFTRDELFEVIKALTAKETVYKTEVDDVKAHLSRVYDAAKEQIGKEFTYAGKWQSLSEAEREIYLPYTLAHLFGKTFLKSIDVAKQKNGGTTPYIDAIGSMISSLSPLHTATQNLILRQVKGRRPVVSTKKVIGTRIQLRAICPVCFREHAVDGGKMVSHGYTLEYGFQNGICTGYRKPHFGTEEGRKVTEAAVVSNRNWAETTRADAEKVRNGTSTSPVRNYKGGEIKEPTQRDRDNYANFLTSNAAQAERYADFLAQQVASWKPRDPKEYTIEVTE